MAWNACHCAAASAGAERNASMTLLTSGNPGASSPALARKLDHCFCFASSAANFSSSATGGAVASAVFLRSNVLRIALASVSPSNSNCRAHQVNIHRRAMRRIAPDRKQQCALQHEPVAMLGLTQPIEQSLKAVLNQHALKRFTARVGDVGKPLAHRCGKILDLGLRHARLSR